MIRVYNDLEALSQAAAEIFTVQSRQASLICGRFSVALSGGEPHAGYMKFWRLHPSENGSIGMRCMYFGVTSVVCQRKIHATMPGWRD